MVEKSVQAKLLGEESKRFKDRFFRGLKEYGYLSLAFIIPAVIMYLIYAAMGIYPIGEGSVLVLDLNGQYVSFYEGLRNFVYGDASLLYSFCRGLGGEFMGMYAYYLASPFSYIVALFPQNMILEALLTIFLLKTGLCGFTFGFYLHKTSRQKKSFSRITVVSFAIMYALTAYCVVQQHNSMWIDAVMWLPIITYGIEELIKKGHFKLYTISLAISVMSNFYIGWMTCIYCAIYFFIYYFMHNENARNNPYCEKNHFFKSLLRIAIFSVIAIAISAVILLTAYYSLTFGKTTFSTTKWDFAMRFELLDMLVKFLPCSYDTVRPEGLPFIYCGVLVLFLIPVFFCSSRFSVREKIFSGIFIVIFTLSFAISPVDIFWHGLQKPNWLNYRYSFMFCFFLLTLAYKGMTEIRRVSAKTLVCSASILLLFIGVVEKMNFKTFVLGDGSNDLNHEVGKLLTVECIWFSVVCVAVYLVMLCVMRKTNKVQSTALIMAVLISVEMFCNGLSNCVDLGSDVVYTSHTTYHNTVDPLREVTSVVKDSADREFYRFEEIYHRKANDNMALDIHGLTSSTSTLNATTIRFLRNMGYFGKSHETRYYAGNVLADSLLNIEYVLAGSADTAAEYKNDKALLVDEKYYSNYYADDNYTVYKNKNALSLGYIVDKAISELDLANYRNPYECLNEIVTAMLGSNELIEVFKPLEDHYIATDNITVSGVRTASNAKYKFKSYTKTTSGKTAKIKITVAVPYIDTDEEIQDQLNKNQAALEQAGENATSDEIVDVSPESQYVYFYLPSEFQRAFKFSCAAGSYGSCFGGGSMRSLYIGKISEGTKTSVTLELESNDMYIMQETPLFYYLDYDAYLDVVERLDDELLNIESFSDDHIIGNISTSKDGSSVFTSIPYDSGWIVKVDGKKVDTYGILGDSSLVDKGATEEGALIAFDIESAGEHKIELIYRPKAFTVGLTITVIGILVLLLLIIFEKPLNRFGTKLHLPLTVPVPESAESENDTDRTDPKERNEFALKPTEPVSSDGIEPATPIDRTDGTTFDSKENEN